MRRKKGKGGREGRGRVDEKRKWSRKRDERQKWDRNQERPRQLSELAIQSTGVPETQLLPVFQSNTCFDWLEPQPWPTQYCLASSALDVHAVRQLRKYSLSRIPSS